MVSQRLNKLFDFRRKNYTPWALQWKWCSKSKQLLKYNFYGRNFEEFMYNGTFLPFLNWKMFKYLSSKYY